MRQVKYILKRTRKRFCNKLLPPYLHRYKPILLTKTVSVYSIIFVPDKENANMTTFTRFLFLACLTLIALEGCHQPTSAQADADEKNASDTLKPALPPAKSRTAIYLDSLGFINIAEADSSIAIDLMYTRADNFTGQVLYEDLREAYLHPEAMESLLKAQELLRREHPGYSLIVYDAARPMSVQQKMWNAVKGTPCYIYVSNPARGGGLHNYGLAVDISIIDAQGQPLPMGTPVDHLGKEAHITAEEQLVRTGKITPQELENRRLLRRVMKTAGFRPLPSEWWHFNRVSRQTAREKYRIIP